MSLKQVKIFKIDRKSLSSPHRLKVSTTNLRFFTCFMQFLFCQFYLGSAKLNAQAVNPNADEVRILDKPE